MLEKTVRVNALFDFYQPLLTPKQQDYMSRYYLDDLSLSEIAEEFRVSRQAVYDNIKRSEQMLEEYESKLRLYEKHLQRQQLIQQLRNLLDGKEDFSRSRANDVIERLEKLD